MEEHQTPRTPTISRRSRKPHVERTVRLGQHDRQAAMSQMQCLATGSGIRPTGRHRTCLPHMPRLQTGYQEQNMELPVLPPLA